MNQQQNDVSFQCRIVFTALASCPRCLVCISLFTVPAICVLWAEMSQMKGLVSVSRPRFFDILVVPLYHAAPRLCADFTWNPLQNWKKKTVCSLSRCWVWNRRWKLPRVTFPKKDLRRSRGIAKQLTVSEKMRSNCGSSQRSFVTITISYHTIT